MKHKALPLTIVCIAFLLGVNCCVAWDLFTLEWARHLGCVESGFIGLARYILKYWPDLTWFPLWYGGVPYQHTYPPLLHLAVAGVAALGRISPARAYHVVTATVYCLGPVTVFLLAYRLSGRRARSFCAALVYSLLSPTHLLVRELREDTGGVLNPRRFYSMVFYGDTPHLAALMLVPVAVLLLDRALGKRTPGSWLLAALALAAVPLTNWLGAFALALAVLAYLVARDSSLQDYARAVGVAVAAYLIASPWIPPSTLNAIRANSYWMSPDNHVEPRNLLYWLPLVAVVGFLLYAFRRWQLDPFWRFVLLFALPVVWITLAQYWFHVILIPQPIRYHMEADLALSLAVTFALAAAAARLPVRLRIAALAVLVLFGAFQVKTCRRFARQLSQPLDLATTFEYRTARWFEAHMAGRRVMATGSGSMYLSALTDVPQLSGGFDQGVTNIVIPGIRHLFFYGWNEIDPSGSASILLMRAFGVHALFVGGPKSREFYRPYKHPERFSTSGLPVLWQEGDDIIYGVPSRSTSLAHVMARQDLVRQRPNIPFHLEEVERYVAAIENPRYPLASIEWSKPHRARVAADFAPGQVLSLQISYHPGWHATVGGERRRVFADGFGFLAVEPACRGRCTVDLVYDGGLEATLARWASGAIFALALLWCAVRARSMA